ncbi:MAG: histidine kinase [Eubacteriales bacterium]|nr:histidine kinase [Eubacteriales bacterium]
MISSKTQKHHHIVRTQLFLILGTAFLLLFLIYGFTILYTQRLMKEEAISSTQTTLSLYVDNIDTQLQQTSSFLSSYIISHDFSGLHRETDESQNAKLEIYKDFQAYIKSYSNTDALFFFDMTDDTFILYSQSRESYSFRQKFSKQLKEDFSSQESSSLPIFRYWTPVAIDHEMVLYEVIQYQNYFVGSWMYLPHLSRPLQTLQESTQGTVFFLSSDQPSENRTFFQVLPEIQVSDSSQYSSDHLLITAESDSGNFSLALYLTPENILKNLTQYTVYSSVILLVIFFVALIVLAFVWRQVITPTETLTSGMNALKSGEQSVILPVSKWKNEFSVLTEQFNEMSSELYRLKVQIYEEQLCKADTELQYLNLQIKPHFFLNSLNIIYNLALTQNYREILEMSRCLMDYFRYTFRSSDSLVCISEELKHVKNYLHIQELRYDSNFDTVIEADEKALDGKIPVLFLQTFVENTIKHAYSKIQNMRISITIQRVVLDKNFLKIEISDNGCGFSEKQIEELNSPLSAGPYPNEHIGILNVRRRLSYLYGSEARLIFSNTEEYGGAKITALLPFDGSEPALSPDHTKKFIPPLMRC